MYLLQYHSVAITRRHRCNDKTAKTEPKQHGDAAAVSAKLYDSWNCLWLVSIKYHFFFRAEKLTRHHLITLSNQVISISISITSPCHHHQVLDLLVQLHDQPQHPHLIGSTLEQEAAVAQPKTFRRGH
jgi:hypothetical protein